MKRVHLTIIAVERKGVNLKSVRVYSCFSFSGMHSACAIVYFRLWLICLYQIFPHYLISVTIFVDPCIIVKFIQKNPERCNSLSKFIISFLYEDQHVSGDTPPIIRNLKLHWQPLVLHTLKLVRRVIAGLCQAEYTLPEKASNHTSNNPTRTQNQRLLVQF